MCLAYVVDADDAKDKMNDDGEETPGMSHVALLLFIICYVNNLFIIPDNLFIIPVLFVTSRGAALLGNIEASAKLITANGGIFTLSSARLSSQSPLQHARSVTDVL